jgi:hypothetical protein
MDKPKEMRVNELKEMLLAYRRDLADPNCKDYEVAYIGEVDCIVALRMEGLSIEEVMAIQP